jgi:hypothetical protein
MDWTRTVTQTDPNSTKTTRDWHAKLTQTQTTSSMQTDTPSDPKKKPYSFWYGN